MKKAELERCIFPSSLVYDISRLSPAAVASVEFSFGNRGGDIYAQRHEKSHRMNIGSVVAAAGPLF